jgi:hypothetical protein
MRALLGRASHPEQRSRRAMFGNWAPGPCSRANSFTRMCATRPHPHRAESHQVGQVAKAARRRMILGGRACSGTGCLAHLCRGLCELLLVQQAAWLDGAAPDTGALA